MLKIKGFKYVVGDVVVPVIPRNTTHYLNELVIDDIHVNEFLYTVVDAVGERWQISPISLENEFVLKGGV